MNERGAGYIFIRIVPLNEDGRRAEQGVFMTDEEKGKAKWWDRMIPHIVTNRQIIALLRLGTLLGKVSDEEIRAHYDANKTILTLTSDFYETVDYQNY